MELLDIKFSALADPTRRAILARLARGEASVSELAAPFALSQPAISKHLKVLENAGLIEAGQSAQRRPRRLKIEALDEVAEWMNAVHDHWAESFDRLDAFLKSNTDKGTETP
jgi:DNA-binding transcriptional ArsR family regulator